MSQKNFDSIDDLKMELTLMLTQDEQLPEVFNILYRKLTNQNYKTTILVRYGEYNSNKKKELSGIVTAESLQVSYAQIINAFSSIIEDLTEDDVDLGK